MMCWYSVQQHDLECVILLLYSSSNGIETYRMLLYLLRVMKPNKLCAEEVSLFLIMFLTHPPEPMLDCKFKITNFSSTVVNINFSFPALWSGPASGIKVTAPEEIKAVKGETVTLSCKFTSTHPLTSRISIDWSFRPQSGGPSHGVSSFIIHWDKIVCVQLSVVSYGCGKSASVVQVKLGLTYHYDANDTCPSVSLVFRYHKGRKI